MHEEGRTAQKKELLKWLPVQVTSRRNARGGENCTKEGTFKMIARFADEASVVCVYHLGNKQKPVQWRHSEVLSKFSLRINSHTRQSVDLPPWFAKLLLSEEISFSQGETNPNAEQLTSTGQINKLGTQGPEYLHQTRNWQNYCCLSFCLSFFGGAGGCYFFQSPALARSLRNFTLCVLGGGGICQTQHKLMLSKRKSARTGVKEKKCSTANGETLHAFVCPRQNFAVPISLFLLQHMCSPTLCKVSRSLHLSMFVCHVLLLKPNFVLLLHNQFVTSFLTLGQRQ